VARRSRDAPSRTLVLKAPCHASGRSGTASGTILLPGRVSSHRGDMLPDRGRLQRHMTACRSVIRFCRRRANAAHWTDTPRHGSSTVVIHTANARVNSPNWADVRTWACVFIRHGKPYRVRRGPSRHPQIASDHIPHCGDHISTARCRFTFRRDQRVQLPRPRVSTPEAHRMSAVRQATYQR
jgi:hypothetical protein